jgi:hypothetical protein
MNIREKFYNSFLKSKKFPAGTESKDALIKNKNEKLDSNKELKKKRVYVGSSTPRRKGCCGR